MVPSAVAASSEGFWPPAMASAALAHSSARRDGLGEFPFSPANSRCLRFSEPWPIGRVPRASVTSMPPAMVLCRRRHCSGRPVFFSLPRIHFWPPISNPMAENVRYPFALQICKRDPRFRMNRTRSPKRISLVTHSRFESVKITA